MLSSWGRDPAGQVDRDVDRLWVDEQRGAVRQRARGGRIDVADQDVELDAEGIGLED